MANELTLFLDAMYTQDSLEHYGVQGMKWGVWNEETRARRAGYKSTRKMRRDLSSYAKDTYGRGAARRDKKAMKLTLKAQTQNDAFDKLSRMSDKIEAKKAQRKVEVSRLTSNEKEIESAIKNLDLAETKREAKGSKRVLAFMRLYDDHKLSEIRQAKEKLYSTHDEVTKKLKSENKHLGQLDRFTTEVEAAKRELSSDISKTESKLSKNLKRSERSSKRYDRLHSTGRTDKDRSEISGKRLENISKYVESLADTRYEAAQRLIDSDYLDYWR